eukprot:TRINITY_DN26060_c0_g1_i2.p1 TRINITY_DN26060_c0_g1~~TRINITY_DN26060_c0_g1_i2.p1  ORF type:complete len:856 (-),score=193.09 TRINITY_DN26060_c0_g1_i2:233-2755(-)
MAKMQESSVKPVGFPLLLPEIPIASFYKGELPEAGTGIPMKINGKYFVYDFMPSYRWAPGYTKEMMAPHMEYVGESKGESTHIHERFQKSLSWLTAKINKKKREETGLKELITEFPKYVQDLCKAYKEVGFFGRDEKFAQMTLIINLMKRKFADRFNELMMTQGIAAEVFREFLIVEPWQTRVQVLLDSTFHVNADATEAKMGSFLISVQNGDLDTPSFHIEYDVLEQPGPKAALARLAKWMSRGSVGIEIYEFRLDIKNEFTEDEESGPKIEGRLKELCSHIGSAEIELFSILNTAKLRAEGFSGHKKIVNQMLEALSTSKALHALQRLNLSDCYVDFETFTWIRKVVTSSNITALKLSRLKLGLCPPDPPSQFQMQSRTMECSLACRLCLGCSDCCSICCVCCGCVKQPDYVATTEMIKEHMNSCLQKNKHISGQVHAAKDMVETFTNMKKHGIVDVIDFTGTRLPDLCATGTGVNFVLKAIAQARPSAICLKNTGLTDNHAAGICQLFFQNPDMLHAELTMACSDMESIENIQSLMQNTPMLVSGDLTQGTQITVSVASDIQLKEEKGKELGCCLAYKVVKVVQTVEEHNFPQTVIAAEDFKVFKDKVEEEIREHLVIPMYAILKSHWADNAKKLKNLARASLDEKYKPVISEEADKPKLQLFQDFLNDVSSKADAMELFHRKLEEVAGAPLAEMLEKQQQAELADIIVDAGSESAAPRQQLMLQQQPPADITNAIEDAGSGTKQQQQKTAEDKDAEIEALRAKLASAEDVGKEVETLRAKVASAADRDNENHALRAKVSELECEVKNLRTQKTPTAGQGTGGLDCCSAQVQKPVIA